MGYMGTIKSFNAAKGWGLISCDETFSMYGKDIFVLKTSLPNHAAEAGTPVRFTVTQGAKGPEASNVRMATQRRPNGVTVPVMLGKGAGKQMMNGKTSMALGPDLSQRTYTGTIKSFNAEKGWGFVSASGHALNVIPKDVFFMRSSLHVPQVSPGESVEFKVAEGQKGLNAIDIRPMLSVDGMSGMSFNGVVKSYNAKKQWGFITGDAVVETFGRDVFFHGKELGDQIPEIGNHVEFMVTSNDQGQPQATKLSLWSSHTFNAFKPGVARATPYSV